VTPVMALFYVRAARTRRDLQVQALDTALLAAIASGCSYKIAADAAHMTPQGLRKRLNRFVS
jgi:hypothetical protein